MAKAKSQAILAVTFVLTAAAVLDVSQSKHQSCTKRKKVAKPTCPLFPVPHKLDLSAHSEFQSLFKWLNTHISSTVNSTTIPSVTANLVYMDEVIWSGNFGQMSKSNNTKPTQDTIYRIGSISKVFPVLFLFKLWEDGKLNINDPVTKFAPDFSVDPRMGKTEDINLIDMASQISGLPGSVPYSPLNESSISFDGPLDEAFRRLKNTVLAARPRSKCIYSNLAFGLLANILTRNFSNFENWTQTNILDALGMEDTGHTYPENVLNKMATGYQPDGSVAPLFKANNAAGNYYSSADDLAKLAMSFLETSNTILESDTLTEMMRTRKICRKGYLGGYADFTGSPWEIKFNHNYKVVRKDGAIHGFSSTMALVPDLKLAFNLLMSGIRTENTAQKVLNKTIPIFRKVLKSIVRKGIPPPDPDKYTGNYTYFNLQNLTLTKDSDGSLELTYFNSPLPPYSTTILDFVSEGVFRSWIKDDGFPCNFVSNLMNGDLISFREIRNGQYQQFDVLELMLFGFTRQESNANG